MKSSISRLPFKNGNYVKNYYKVQGFVNNTWNDVKLGSDDKIVAFPEQNKDDMWNTIKLSFPLFHWKEQKDVKVKKIRIVKCTKHGKVV